MSGPSVVSFPIHPTTVRTMAISSRTELGRGETRSCRVCGSMLLEEHIEETPTGTRCLFCGARLPIDHAARRPTVPGDVGETLRTARLARHETLTDAARWTCVQSRYLLALERNHTVDEFPGRVYARYFLREYAEHLELDPEPLLRSFDAEGEPVISLPKRDRLLSRRQPRWGRAAIISLMLLVLIGGLSQTQLLVRDERTASPGASMVAAHAGSIRGHAHETTGAATRPTAGLGAVLALDAPCWVAVTVDGRELSTRTYRAGRILRYRAEHTIELWLGNAGAVTLSINGRRVRTGVSGQPVRLTFVWKHGRAEQVTPE